MMSPGPVPAGTAFAGEAAKLLLLRRVGAPVGDDLLTQLQPMLLLYELLRAGLAGPRPDLQALRKQTEGIKPAVQKAMAAGAAAAEWLLPVPGARTLSTELFAECAELLRPGFELCGVGMEIASEGDPLPIERAPGRTMVCAVLAHVGDRADGPARIRVQLRHRDGACEVRVCRKRAEGALTTDFLKPPQAPMAWDELQALAQLERTSLRREDDGTVVLELGPGSGA